MVVQREGEMSRRRFCLCDFGMWLFQLVLVSVHVPFVLIKSQPWKKKQQKKPEQWACAPPLGLSISKVTLWLFTVWEWSALLWPGVLQGNVNGALVCWRREVLPFLNLKSICTIRVECQICQSGRQICLHWHFITGRLLKCSFNLRGGGHLNSGCRRRSQLETFCFLFFFFF